MKHIRQLIEKYKELISYIFWGAVVTAVNYGIYFCCTKQLQLDYLISNVISWIISVAFAFVVNKLFVFASKSWSIEIVLPELWKFVSARIFSGALETGLLFLFVTVMHMNDSVIKIIAGIVVIILNYIMSKLLIFKKVNRCSNAEDASAHHRGKQ